MSDGPKGKPQKQPERSDTGETEKRPEVEIADLLRQTRPEDPLWQSLQRALADALYRAGRYKTPEEAQTTVKIRALPDVAGQETLDHGYQTIDPETKAILEQAFRQFVIQRNREIEQKRGEPASFAAVQALDRVPQDPELYEITREFIGADLTEKDLEVDQKLSDGRTLRKYKKDYGSHRQFWTYIFPAEMEVKGIPAIGEEVFYVFSALTAFAYKQETISPVVHFRELQRWIRPGEDPVGWRKTAYENYLKSLAGLTLERQTKIGGKWKTETIEHLLDVEFIRSGEKGEVITAIRPTLAPRAMERLSKTLRGEVKGGRYISASRALLTGRGLEKYSRDTRKALRQLETYQRQRATITISYKRLFTNPKWLGWDTAKMVRARPGDLLAVHRELVEAITALKLGDHTIQYPPTPPGGDLMGDVGTILLWKMKFIPSDMGELRKIGRDESEIKSEFDLTERLIDWNVGGGVTKEKAELRTMIGNVIRKYGGPEVLRIWKASAKPRDFWNRIKAIKRQGGTPPAAPDLGGDGS